MTFLDGFAAFVASLVFFKFMFALIYVLKWNFRTWCNQYYKKGKEDVSDNFKRMRKNPDFAYSSDEDDENDPNKSYMYSEKIDQSVRIKTLGGD